MNIDEVKKKNGIVEEKKKKKGVANSKT